MIRVLLFGRLRDVAGFGDTVIDAAPASLGALKRLIGERWPELSEALKGPGVQTAIDRALVRGDASLRPGAEVAFMPPMSGG